MDIYGGNEPELSPRVALSGLEPALRPRTITLDGITFTSTGWLEVPKDTSAVIPTPDARRPLLAMGQGRGPGRHARVTGDPVQLVPLELPSDAAACGVDDAHRIYLTTWRGTRLLRYTAALEPDLAVTLRGTRNVTVGRDGNLYAWLFSSRDLEVYGPDGGLLRVLEHGWHPYSLAVDPQGAIWLGDASDSHIFEVSPETGETLLYLDPKEDFTAQNLFSYTYAMEVDRHGNLWTFNGIGELGSTIINADRTAYIRYASKELGPEFEDSEPVPSPWHDEVYFLTEDGHLAVFDVQLTGWRTITPDIHG